MAEERVEHRLTAILAADIVDYSRLTGANEDGTLTELKHHRPDLNDPSIEFATKAAETNLEFLETYAVLTAAHGQLGRTEAACAALDQLQRRMPGLTATDGASTARSRVWPTGPVPRRIAQGRHAGVNDTT